MFLAELPEMFRAGFRSRLAEINRSHGSRSDMADDTHQQAVRDADNLYRRLRPVQKRGA